MDETFSVGEFNFEKLSFNYFYYAVLLEMPFLKKYTRGLDDTALDNTDLFTLEKFPLAWRRKYSPTDLGMVRLVHERREKEWHKDEF
jgi:hypothetical protein